MTALGKGDQTYETVGLPRQVISAPERYRSVFEPPTEDWPVFPPCTHLPCYRPRVMASRRTSNPAEEIETELDT